MKMRTCVTPEGKFRYGVHHPSYQVCNLRQKDHHFCLGRLPDETMVHNQDNFPEGDLQVNGAFTVYEIPNAFSFRGSTFIDSGWAASRAKDPLSIRISPPGEVSLLKSLDSWAAKENMSSQSVQGLFQELPHSLLLALATTSTDPQDLVRLAHLSCDFIKDSQRAEPVGLAYSRREDGSPLPVIHDRDLFEAVGNNPFLPDIYKEIMLLRPGVQGRSEIVGDVCEGEQSTRVFEYLRRNSYIPWGHYASNMSHQEVRYRAADLSLKDMQGLRHLYYQRTYVRLARELGLEPAAGPMSPQEMEQLRQAILAQIEKKPEQVSFTSTLWGWNFGFDFAPTRYRLHGSHQQVHQQHAMVPQRVPQAEQGRLTGEEFQGFSAGDMIAETVKEYLEETGQDFFRDYIRCLRNNTRLDGGKGEESLVVHEDKHVLLFVPKAQVSQWELQLLPQEQVGSILEADDECRRSLDRAMLLALQILEGLGARMVTSIEYSGRFTSPGLQRLMYSFLPKLPWSPGSFSEAQHRFICGHYPEDFAAACRNQAAEILQDPGLFEPKSIS
ncbi:conserved hypothetical protein [Desulfonatronospira thiodismutans ASO3-1]|uniref:Uncharacterized protein n=3 Tax=Desulfonatronospira TaxID=488937 RepID=D6SQV1_9BACT|nr:hypothetical protein [Desulfonatronospira thiodismutans]EFI35127.1 conserved hypothetical protein [Desulfonatronospira thiodismutans ASO3-1]